MKEKRVVIVLPMYNEELSIPLLRRMFDQSFTLLPGYDYRIVTVNDGSQDNTLPLLNQWAQANKRIHVLTHAKNKGIGQALLSGFYEAIRMNAFCVVTLDADATHPGALIQQMIEKNAAGTDIVIASRFAPGGRQYGVPALRRLYSFCARFLLSIVFPLQGVKDYTISFRSYLTPLLNEALSQSQKPFIHFRSFASSVEILLKIGPLAHKIEEVPLILHYDHKISPSKLKLGQTLRDYRKLFFLPKQKGPLGRGLAIS